MGLWTTSLWWVKWSASFTECPDCPVIFIFGDMGDCATQHFAAAFLGLMLAHHQNGSSLCQWWKWVVVSNTCMACWSLFITHGFHFVQISHFLGISLRMKNTLAGDVLTFAVIAVHGMLCVCLNTRFTSVVFIGVPLPVMIAVLHTLEQFHMMTSVPEPYFSRLWCLCNISTHNTWNLIIVLVFTCLKLVLFWSITQCMWPPFCLLT